MSTDVSNLAETDDVSRHFKPKLLIVDDVYDEVKMLISVLEEHGFVVSHALNRRAAIDMLGGHVYDLALIDVKFDDNLGEGLTIGEEIASVARDTDVVFISRPEIVNIPILLRMFNIELRGPRRGRSLAKAYAKKFAPIDVLDTCLAVLGNRAPDRVGTPIRIEEPIWSSIVNELTRKVGADPVLDGKNLVEPTRQFIQILRQLTSHECMQLDKVRVQGVSRGRSRTVVIVATSTYKPTQHDHHVVIKIGNAPMLETERDNYLRWIQSFVRCGTYPTLTKFAAARQLAGIAYSMVAVEGGGPAPTFTERFWSMEQSQAIAVLSHVFHDVLATHDVPRQARARSLQLEYRDRFRALGDLEALEHGQGSRRIGLAAIRQDLNIKTSGNGDWEFVDERDHRPVKTPNPLTCVQGLYDPYVESLVHGDLHTDNIIVLHTDNVREQGDRAFLIDFAHTGRHHIFLDYVVMEASVRQYLLHRLLGQQSANIDTLIRQWSKLEVELARVPPESFLDVTVKDLVPDLNENLVRLAEVVLWLRRSAFVRGSGDTYRNYFAALGMGCITLPLLSDQAPRPVRHAVRRTVLLCGALSLERATQLDKQSIDASLPSGRRDALLAALTSMSEVRLQGAVRKEIASWTLRPQASLDLPMDTKAAIETWLRSIEETWPMLYGALDRGRQNMKTLPGLDPDRAQAVVLTLLLNCLGGNLGGEYADLKNEAAQRTQQIRNSWQVGGKRPRT